MYYKIGNEKITAEIDDMGAQLHSLKTAADGKEYLWQGDTSIWYGQAPVLFPVIGQLLDNKYRYNGVEYEMAKHGFARKMLFKLHEITAQRAVFVLSSNDETRRQYPFEFDLFVSFETEGDTLVCTFRVVNKSSGEMLFSIGAHPGFNCKLGDKLIFEKKETLETQRIDSGSLLVGETIPVMNNTDELEITAGMFNNDALIFTDVLSSTITMRSGTRDYLRFSFDRSPYLGIWAKPAAPYVCLEPWCGLNDSRVKKDDLSQKTGIIRLDEGGEFAYCWRATP